MDFKTSNYLQHSASIFHQDPMGKKDGAPSSQTRSGFSFNIGSRKSFPSKWDDAEKWLISGHDSPANFLLKQCGIKQDESRVVKESYVFQEPKIVSLDHDVLLKGKFNPKFILKSPKYVFVFVFFLFIFYLNHLRTTYPI